VQSLRGKQHKVVEFEGDKVVGASGFESPTSWSCAKKVIGNIMFRNLLVLKEMVGANGFEPSTSWSRTRHLNPINALFGVAYGTRSVISPS